ncbi:MAG: hypothetical protein GYA78_00820 [Caldisericales bacterium]|jgi:hypothetical protein|nr:hypothetical protein [Caldisericales bacterium]
MFFTEEHRIKTWWLLCPVLICIILVNLTNLLQLFFWIFQNCSLVVPYILFVLFIICPLPLVFTSIIVYTYEYSKYTVKIDSEKLNFGYSSFVTEVPISSIQKVTFEKMGFWRSIGTMLYINQGIRLNQAVSFGTGIKIDCENGKKYFFSVKNIEEIRKILINLLGKEKILTA